MRKLRSEVESQKFVFSTTTSAIRVSAQPFFLEEQSSPCEKQFVWAYKIRIENRGAETVQLLARRWYITDCHGFSQEVEGSGVVGEQPILKPGEQFEYSSYTSLHAASGLMTGNYKMSTSHGQVFEVAIPAFSLDSPEQLSMPN